MKVQEMEITPDKAKEMLKGNDRNRRMNMCFVKLLAKDMAEGRWQMNGDAIRFNGKLLLDGQHRLAACIEANKPFRTLVVTGLESDCFKTIDTGHSRSGSDLMHLAGEQNTKVLCSACNWVNRYFIDTRRHTLDTRLTSQQMMDLLAKHPGLRDSVQWYSTARGRPCLRAAWHAAYHYLFGIAHPTSRDEFYEGLRDGEGLVKDTPIYTLRAKLTENAASHKKMVDTHLIALTIKAFNMFLEKRKCVVLRWVDSEAYPQIKGLPASGASDEFLLET